MPKGFSQFTKLNNRIKKNNSKYFLFKIFDYLLFHSIIQVVFAIDVFEIICEVLTQPLKYIFKIKLVIL